MNFLHCLDIPSSLRLHPITSLWLTVCSVGLPWPILRSAARLFSQVPHFRHVSNYMVEVLRWLPVRQLIWVHDRLLGMAAPARLCSDWPAWPLSAFAGDQSSHCLRSATKESCSQSRSHSPLSRIANKNPREHNTALMQRHNICIVLSGQRTLKSVI